jgi:hypothetical protein
MVGDARARTQAVAAAEADALHNGSTFSLNDDAFRFVSERGMNRLVLARERIGIEPEHHSLGIDFG